MGIFQALKEEAIDNCRGRVWWIRVPFLLYFAYVLIRHLQNPLYKSIIGALNLGIHELGHVITCFAGPHICAFAGTGLQCLVPVLAMWNFYRQKDFFAISLCFGWLSTNFFEVATYLADSRSLSLPLVSLGPSAKHDWNYLLSEMNLLQYDTLIADWIRLFGVATMFACFVSGGWIILQMYKYRNEGIMSFLQHDAGNVNPPIMIPDEDYETPFAPRTVKDADYHVSFDFEDKERL